MLSTELFVLGTSSQFPTATRNHPGIFLRFNKFQALFDCGEGTQRQMRIAKLSPHHVNAMFISHFHGDHSLGIGGMIQSLSASKREVTLDVYGPIGTKERISHIVATYYFKKTFKINVHEFNPKDEETIVDAEDYYITCFPLDHGIPCIGFAFYTKPVRKINLDYVKKFGLVKNPLLGKLQRGETIVYNNNTITPEKGTYLEKGYKICFISDTKYFEELISYAKDSSLLVCEATFSKSDEALCSEYEHLSNEQAATIAKQSRSKRLYLTHISQRYSDVSKLESEARAVFENTVYANDFDCLEVK